MSSPAAPTEKIFVRRYGLPDLPLVRRWHRQHTGQEFPGAFMSIIGLVAEDERGPCGAVWMHPSVGSGVAHIEQPVSRPGMAPKLMLRVMGTMVNTLRAVAKANDIRVLIAYPRKSFARVLPRLGWEGDGHCYVLFCT